MAARLISRFLPPTTGEPSIYETLRQHDELDHSDIERTAGLAMDEDNEQREQFHDYNTDGADEDAGDQGYSRNDRDVKRKSPSRRERLAQTKRRTTKGTEMEDLDDEVPMSLLIEGDEDRTPVSAEPQNSASPPALSPANLGIRAKWQTTQQQQRLYQDATSPHDHPISRLSGRIRAASTDPKEKALWLWANVENLDNFLAEVYDYFIGNGIWSITLHRMLDLMLVLIFSSRI